MILIDLHTGQCGELTKGGDITSPPDWIPVYAGIKEGKIVSAPSLPDMTIKGAVYMDGLVATVFGTILGSKAPMATYFVALNDLSADYLWRSLNNLPEEIDGTWDIILPKRPQAPWCAVKVDLGGQLKMSPTPPAFWIDYGIDLAKAWSAKHG